MRAFVREFFAQNPSASVHQACRALNNARLPPLHAEVVRVRDEMERAKPWSSMVLPAAPRQPPELSLVTPPVEEEEEVMPPSPVPSPVADRAAQEAMQKVARSLLVAMREHGIESIVLTIEDPDIQNQKPRVTVEPTYRQAPKSWDFTL
ncbi:MAG: hypothetical protein SFW67_28500 [Myxococcaceae bacterium]|nr:hypothetical protein [Myxococcaceae bacterium]